MKWTLVIRRRFNSVAAAHCTEAHFLFPQFLNLFDHTNFCRTYRFAAAAALYRATIQSRYKVCNKCPCENYKLLCCWPDYVLHTTITTTYHASHISGGTCATKMQGRRKRGGTEACAPQYFDHLVLCPLNIFNNFQVQLNICPSNIFRLPTPLKCSLELPFKDVTFWGKVQI